jgi:serine/threonine protein phosphatase 1
LFSLGFLLSLAVFQRSVDFRFAALRAAKRVWTIPSIHAEFSKLRDIHDTLINHIKPGDRIVYLGNYVGHGVESVAVIDELLAFRRMVLSVAGVQPNDIIYLRGQQEEMLNRIFQLPLASSPHMVLEWMLDQGLGSTLSDYGIDIHEGLRASVTHVNRLVRWSQLARHIVNLHSGHDLFFSQLKRAAFTQHDQTTQKHQPLLFVSTGLKTDLRLEDQGDRFWWGGDDFQTMTDAYNPFSRVIRGFDPQQRGLYINCVTATVDNGCGFGGSLTCTAWMPDASVGEIFEA